MGETKGNIASDPSSSSSHTHTPSTSTRSIKSPKGKTKTENGGKGKGSENGKMKRIPSCDICRMRKVKCVKQGGQTRCQGCVELDRACTYNYCAKKPGPPNPYSRSVIESYTPYPTHRIRQSNHTNHIHSPTSAVGSQLPSSVGLPAHFPSGDHNGILGLSPLEGGASHSELPPLRHAYGSNDMHHIGGTHQQSHAHTGAGVIGPSPSSGSTSFTPPDILNTFDMTDDLFRPWICSTDGGNFGSGSQTGGDHHGFQNGHHMDPLVGLGGGGGGGGGYDWDLPGPSSSRKVPTPIGRNDTGISNDPMFQDFDATMTNVTGVGVNNQSQTHRLSGSSHISQSQGGPMSPLVDNGPLASIEDLTRWSTILTFLSLYFEHLYPLLPLMHWPSFSQQLIARQDRKDPVFRAFLLSLVAYSILQLPKSVIPSSFTSKELKALHYRCHLASRRLQPRLYEPPQLMHISTLYCDHIYLGSTGNDNAANAVLAEAMRLAIAMGLHDDSVAEQAGMDAIEKETRRRVFWVLYGSDRTIATLISCPMLLSDEDIFVSDPLEVDDSLITAAGSFQQPIGRTPIISGFVHVSRIFRLLSHVLRLVRQRARAQSIDGDTDAFPDPRSLIRSLQALLDDLPPPLRLQSDIHEKRSQHENNAFETCKANLLVNQVLVRFAIYQYAMLRSVGRPEQYLDELTEDVLKTLHNMSSESLAANGESIRRKVLFIASSLLNKYPGDNAGHDHVADFLNVYNKILREQTTTGIVSAEEQQEQEQQGQGHGQGDVLLPVPFAV